MEQEHRRLIRKEMEQLIKHTQYDALVKACIRWKLISPTMRTIIEDVPCYNDNGNVIAIDLEYERHKRLFEKITRRGPNAFQTLKSILSELNYHNALQILYRFREDDTNFVERNRSTEIKAQMIPPKAVYNNNNEIKRQEKTPWQSMEDDGIPPLDEYTNDVQPIGELIVKKSKDIGTDALNGVYPMKSEKNRGVFFMVNIIDFNRSENRRNGAEEDEKALLYLFKEMGFKLFAYNNLTQHQFLGLLDALIASEDVRRTECFVMALLTHGNFSTTEVVEFTDGSVYKVDDILSRFENIKCPDLVGKPKIFLFPFCRGDRSDKIGYMKIQTDSIPSNDAPTYEKTTSKLSDICICYAALSGHRAHRDVESGSWYIQEFCKLMADHAHESHFEDIVKKVQENTSALVSAGGDIQTGNYLNIGFNKKLFFNPGKHEDIDNPT